nr:RHS repeat-associated core domain-containing protein [Pseudomarimonas arenosa]
MRFLGQQFDRETGLHYNYYRDYDPSTGRYIQSDPIGLEGGINPYVYVAAQPLVAWDAEGLRYPGSAIPQPKPGKPPRSPAKPLNCNCGPSSGGKAPHGNSKDYKGPTHVYVITDNHNGSLLKVGKGKGNGIGGSQRCMTQTRRLNRLPGNDGRFECVVRRQFCSTADALRYETDLRDKLRGVGNSLPGNREHMRGRR